MPEWLAEHGIGETRLARVVDGEIVEARVLLSDSARAGTRILAKLKAVRPRTIAEANGQEYLLPKGAPGVAEGAGIVIEVTREVIPGHEPWKRPLAKVSSEDPGEAVDMEAQLLPFPSPDDRLGAAGWWDLIEQARTGIIRFGGGELRVSPTPAMTLIDVDGHLPADELAVAGAAAAGKAICRFDIGGSIGIDLPTAGSKAVRQAAAAAIDEVLPRPFERTSVNGFGFLQVVRARPRASIIELAQDRTPFEARALMRSVACGAPGSKRLVVHPAVASLLEERPDWLEALARQVGGAVSLHASPSVTISGGYAETP